jgi:hypothetical protein
VIGQADLLAAGADGDEALQFADALLHLFLQRDIPDAADNGHLAARVVDHRPCPHGGPDRLVVGPTQPELDLRIGRACGRRLPERVERRPVLGVHQLGEQPGIFIECRRLMPGQGDGRRTDILEAAVENVIADDEVLIAGKDLAEIAVL